MSNRIKIIIGIFIFLLFITFAVSGYMILLDLSFIDALYMTVITVSTVGYTELAEMTDSAKLFSIVIITISVGFLGFLLSHIIRMFSESLVKDVWRKKRMDKEIKEMKNHFIICGAGETGMQIVKQFLQSEVPFVVVENDEETIEALYKMSVHFVHDDATHEDSLISANIKHANGLITTLSKDADNVFVVLSARELNKDLHIVARVHNESAYKKLKRAGADNTVSPNEIGGKKMASMVLKPSLSTFMDHIIDTGNISLDLGEVKIEHKSEICNLKLKDAKISEKAGLIVLAIRKHPDENFLFNPNADEVLKANDRMIVVGEKDQIQRLKVLAKGDK